MLSVEAFSNVTDELIEEWYLSPEVTLFDVRAAFGAAPDELFCDAWPITSDIVQKLAPHLDRVLQYPQYAWFITDNDEMFLQMQRSSERRKPLG